GRSRRKFRSSRGEYWVEDSCKATTVRPSSNAITVTIVPAIPISNVRASSEVPWNASGERGPTRISDSSDPAARAASTDSVGSTHSDPRTYSDSASRRIMASLPHADALTHAGQSPQTPGPALTTGWHGPVPADRGSGDAVTVDERRALIWPGLSRRQRSYRQSVYCRMACVARIFQPVAQSLFGRQIRGPGM